jgi:hypothetical protein
MSRTNKQTTKTEITTQKPGHSNMVGINVLFYKTEDLLS